MTKIKEKIKAIIFDMDGTIVQTEYAWAEAIKKVLAQRGITLKNETEMKIFNSVPIGQSLHDCWERLQKMFSLNDCSYTTLSEECQNYVIEQFKNGGITFKPGFEDFHKKLREHKIATCIATNSDDRSLDQLKKSMNLSQFFGNDIFSISHVNNKAKPNPAIFLYAAKQLNVNPKECVIFEDSLAGFQAAKTAGIKCIAIKNDYNTDSLYHADGIIDHYDFAHEALNKLIRHSQSITSKKTVSPK